jgi:surface protein
MGDMFYGCNDLVELNLSGWNFSKIYFSVDNLEVPTSLKRLNMANTKYNGSLRRAFEDMSSLEELNLE